MALNVIALVSGGKDSMFSMLHCAEQGHTIVALANLHPSYPADVRPGDDDRDLNSFMYQTVGHGILPLYQQVLGLPLYRRAISGTAKNASKDYVPTAVSGDEAEDMYALLSEIKKAHPEANAVSTGAILSTYQRTRVESVALRLGLIPLAYLWQYPVLPCSDPSPSALLRHMAAVGLDARIIKVASGGLDESFLWQNLCDTRTIQRVQRAADRFGGNVLGEGGEFETLVVAGPAPMWKAKIIVADADMNTVIGEGGESFLNLSAGRVKDGSTLGYPKVTSIPLFDARVERLLPKTELDDWCPKFERSNHSPKAAVRSHYKQPVSQPKASLQHLNNVTANGETIAGEAKAVCAKFLTQLTSQGLSVDNVVHTTILLRDMSDFAQLNETYGELFKKPLPPSRITVACGDGLADSTSMALSAVLHSENIPPCGLHVQTRSYWAPANIGPYSQARSFELRSGHSLVFIAGQIPLIPATMGPYEPRKGSVLEDFVHQAALSMQHLWRIGTEQRVGFWTGAVAYIALSDNFEARAFAARKLWSDMHIQTEGEQEEEADIDVWDQRNLNQHSWVTPQEQSHSLPDFARIQCKDTDSGAFDTKPKSVAPGFFAVEIAELPRRCPIEWQSSGLVWNSSNQSCEISQEFMTSVRGDQRTSKETIIATSKSDAAYTSPGQDASTFGYVEIVTGADQSDLLQEVLEAAADRGCHCTVYTTSQLTLDYGLPGCVFIPCKRIFGSQGKELAAGVIRQHILVVDQNSTDEI